MLYTLSISKSFMIIENFSSFMYEEWNIYCLGSSTATPHHLLDNEHYNYSAWICSGSENCLCNCTMLQQDDCKNNTAHVSCGMPVKDRLRAMIAVYYAAS